MEWDCRCELDGSALPERRDVQHPRSDARALPRKDTKLYDWRKIAFLQRMLTERPARWLPAGYKNYDELLSAAADRAVEKLEAETKDPNMEDWSWKRFNYLDMLHPIGREGTLKKLLSLTDEPQSGTLFSPRAASRHHG